MTPHRGLKRLALGIAVAVAGAAGVLASIPLLVRADAVRDAVQAEIRNATGFEPMLRGAVSIAALPSTSARFADIVLGAQDAGEPALTAERLTARLRLLPLILGRIEVADITLETPRISLTVDAAGNSNWDALLQTLSRSFQPGGPTHTPVSFSEIRLVGGTIAVRSQREGASEVLEAMDASLAWPSISKSFGATGSFVWRREKVEASINVSDFLAALKGDRSGVKVRLNGAPLKLAFDGHVAHKPTLKLDGTLTADGASLRQALFWTAQRPLPAGGFGRFALKAQTNVVGDTIALSSVNLELDGNAAEGVLTFTGDKRPVLQGTLAAEQIDVSPYVSEIRLTGAHDGYWNRVPIGLDGFGSVDFDLRVSASVVKLGDAKVGRTAVGASLREGRLALTIGESQAFGGVLKGAMGIAKVNGGADIKAELQFVDVDMQSCLNALFGVKRLEGKGDLALLFESSGRDVASIAASMGGSGRLTASRGALHGLNVEQLLRRLERRPLSGGGDFRSGRTPFEKLTVDVQIAGGAAKVESVKLDGQAVKLTLDGTASIPARDLDLKGIASLAAAPREGASPFELPFVVRGSWDDPVMMPDVQSLIRRSGAAAPLLDAVRDGRSRDAVRSAIEQLTQGGTPAAAPASGTAPAQ